MPLLSPGGKIIIIIIKHILPLSLLYCSLSIEDRSSFVLFFCAPFIVRFLLFDECSRRYILGSNVGRPFIKSNFININKVNTSTSWRLQLPSRIGPAFRRDGFDRPPFHFRNNESVTFSRQGYVCSVMDLFDLCMACVCPPLSALGAPAIHLPVHSSPC